MGFIAFLLLNYGRRRIHLNESYNQIMSSIHGPIYSQDSSSHPLFPHSSSSSPPRPRLSNSRTASDIITLTKESQRFISLTLLWYYATGIHLFGFLWGLLGIFWYRGYPHIACDSHLIKVYFLSLPINSFSLFLTPFDSLLFNFLDLCKMSNSFNCL